MKDKFFSKLKKIYILIYKIVTKITYICKINKRVKHYPKLNYKEKKYIKSFWKKEYGKSIPTSEYKWYKEKMGYVDSKIIPDIIWHSEIEPYFSNMTCLSGFADKNYFDLIIGKENTPETIIRCIDNQLLDENYLPLNFNNMLKTLKNDNEFICKPSIDSGGGRNIIFIKSTEFNIKTLQKLSKKYKGNFLIQKLIIQNDFLKKFNENSLNTMRIVTFLYKNKVHFLSSFLRIGAKASRLDNVSGGGYFIHITNEGKLGKYAYKENFLNADLEKFQKLDNNISFQNLEIPYWKEIQKKLIKFHYRLSHFKIINWDVTIDEKNSPKIIEYNLIDSSTYFHQINNNPILGDLTVEVLNDIRDSRRKDEKK